MEKMKLEELVQLYRETQDTLSEWEKAELENQIWEARFDREGPGLSRISERREWFRNKFGGNCNIYEKRSALFRSREWTQPIWDKINGGMPLTTAYPLYKRAKELSKVSGDSEQKSLEIILKNPRAGLPPIPPPSGVQVITAPPVIAPKEEPIPVIHHKKEKINPKEEPSETPQISNSKEYFRRMKDLTDSFVKSSLVDIEPYLADQLSQEFTGWVREAYDDLRRKVSKHRQEASRTDNPRKRVSRAVFKRACEVLAFQAVFGKSLDLRAAKRRMITRARDLHPDRRDGSTETVAEYRAVVEAYQVLEQYTDEMTQ